MSVGPVPSASVAAYVDFATAVLDEGSEKIEPDVREAFRGYLDEWRTDAATGTDVSWTREVPQEVAEYLMLAFYRVARERASRPQARTRPPEADAFYWALVRAVLAALEEAGAGTAEFADHLRSFWPGLGDA